MVVVTTFGLREVKDSLGIQIVALLYLLPVMLSTALWGLTPGILAGLASFLLFNYYFFVPYQSLAVHRTQDLLTLIIFLVVAVVISQLLGRAKSGVMAANNREREATRLYELSAALSGSQDPEEIARTLANHTCETFNARKVEIQIPPKGDVKGFSASSADLPLSPWPGRQDRQPPRPQEELKLIRVPMLTARGQEGEICLWTSNRQMLPHEERLLQTFASQGALSFERARLAQTENRARVLEESDRLKSALLSSVSHELRTPLATIKASISSLRSGAVEVTSEAGFELMSAIEEESDHLNQLVGNLLDMSRIETGALRPTRQWNSIGEIVGEVIKRLRQSLQRHEIVLEIPPDLPPVPTDYIQMQQVFTNLISNSIKYAPENSTIWIRAALQPDQFLLVQVVNQGPPVAEEHLSRIFDKFYRVTAADKVTGTGLGLSICKGIVEAHGGKIWAENAPGKFIFSFTLPMSWEGEPPRVVPAVSVEAKNE